MDLSINNLTFNSRYTKVSKASMDKVLLPMLEDHTIDFKTLVDRSGYTNNSILSWFKQSLGTSANQYFKQRKNNVIKSEIIDLYNKGVPITQIAEYFDVSVKWVYEQFRILGLKTATKSVNEQLNLKMPAMLKEGYTISAMANALGCSVSKIRGWITKNLRSGIVDYRHKKAVYIQRPSKKTNVEEKLFIQKCFESGKTLKEVADLLDMSITRVIRLKDKYGLTTEKDRGYELMDIFLDDMVKSGDKLKTMSRFFGLSESTIARRIKEVYGKSSLDIRLNR